MPATALVWLKRELRLADHAPLAAAAAFERALALFVLEPEWLASPDFDGIHLDFTLDCLADLRGLAGFKGNKQRLPSKPCQACGRTMSWRKAWAKNWDAVRYCSDACRKRVKADVKA